MDRWIEIPSEAKYGKHVLFENGRVYFDHDAKELVIVTNGTCTLPHTNETYDGHMTNGGCCYAPSEAIAFRVVALAGKGDPVIALTYRKVRPEALSPVSAANEAFVKELSAKVRRSRFAGRV